MRPTHLHLEWQPGTFSSGFHTGVSLHSHTLHSKESLDFIYKVARQVWPLQQVLRKGEAQFLRYHGVEMDLNRGWWTPPLAPLDAYKLEAAQVEALGLAPMVSLTDHDEIEAPMSLQASDSSRHIPVSVEWTVPFGPTFFHLGVHNLPPSTARSAMATLRAFTAAPTVPEMREILEQMHNTPGVLTVFNHPMWDEKGVGASIHEGAVRQFMGLSGHHIHAIEINGLRPWSENRKAIRLAEECSKPVISGGDRHAVEANTVLNLSRAGTFNEFVDEVRAGHSDVLITRQYRQAHLTRLMHNLVAVMQTYEDHGHGWREWPDRVFYHCPDDVVRSLRQLWGEKHPAPVRVFNSMVRFAANSPMQTAMRVASARAEQVVP
jgi:hypothetical protein